MRCAHALGHVLHVLLLLGAHVRGLPTYISVLREEKVVDPSQNSEQEAQKDPSPSPPQILPPSRQKGYISAHLQILYRSAHYGTPK